MRFFTNEEVDSALEHVIAMAEGRAGPDRANYLALSDADFELLLYAVYKRRAPNLAYDNARLMITGADQGRDIWLTLREKPVGLVQCKKIKSGFSLPDTIREVVKFLLNVALDPGLMGDPTEFCFTLALSTEPAGTTTGFFEAPHSWLKANDAKLPTFVAEVIKKYKAFAGLDADALMPPIRAAMGSLRYELLRPVDLDELLEHMPTVRQRFFKVQLVVSIAAAGAMLDARFAAAGLFAPSLATMAPADARADAARGSRGLREWPQDIWGQHIDRPELDRLIQRIDQQPSGATLVVGGAGTGKSALLAELYIVLRARGQPVLAIKADMLSPDVADFTDLARDLGMVGDIERGLLSLAAEQPLVLIIDQLDAVCEVMDQSSQRMQVLVRLASRLQVAKTAAGEMSLPIHVIVSSRPFEARFDARFGQLGADEVTLSLPPYARAATLLTELGIDATAVPETLRETLRTPFALGIYVDLVKAGSNPAELMPFNLLDRWLDRKTPSGAARAPFMAFLRQLAADMTEYESLWRPAVHYEPEHSAGVRTAESVGILIREGANIGFNHQSWLDDFQAKAFRTGDDLAAFAWSRQEGLFARGTILRGLEHMRRIDVPAYGTAIHLLLLDGQTRRHLRHLVVDFLSGVDDPTAREIGWIEWMARNDRALANRALQKAVVKWSSWREGLLPLIPFLMQDERYRWNATTPLIQEAAEDPEKVMDLVDRYWPDADHDGNVFTIFDRSAIATGRALARARTIFGRTSLADWPVSHYATALHANGKTDIAIDLVAAWADTQTEDRHKGIRVDNLEKISEASPLHYAQRFLPWFVGVAARATDEGRAGRRFPQSASLAFDWKYDRGQGYLTEVLRAALARCAVTEPEQTRTLLASIDAAEIDEVQSTIADTLAANPQAFAANALAFLLADQRRLHLGTDTFNDDDGVSHMTSGWSSNNLIAQIAPHLSKADIDRLRDYIEAWEAWAVELKQEGVGADSREYLRWSKEERFRLLAELPETSLAARRRRQVAEWKAGQPKLSAKPKGRMMAQFVGTPMNHEQMANASDEAVFTMLDEIDDHAGPRNHPKHWLKGGVSQLSQAFAEFAKANPNRVIRIIQDRLQAGRHEQAAGAAIRELSAIESVDALALKALIWELHERGFASHEFRHDAAGAMEKLAGRLKGLEARDTDLLRSWLQRDAALLREETIRNAELRRSNRERNEKPDQIPQAVLFGRGGGLHIIPQRNFTILSAIAAGYLRREGVDCDGWLTELETHVEQPEDPEIWSAIIMWRSHELWWADPARTGALIGAIWRRFPAAFDDAAIVQALWRLRPRLSFALRRDILNYWGSHVDHRLRQIAGEFAVACAIVDQAAPSDILEAIETFMAGNDLYAKVGVLFAAAAGWREDDLAIRTRSHGYLIRRAESATGFEAHALSTAVDHDNRLPPDDMTRALLMAIKSNTELLKASVKMFFIQSLQGLLLHPGFEVLVLEVAEATTELTLASRDKAAGLYDGELVGLAITLQRSPPEIRSRAMAVYEKLLDAEVHGAEEAAAFALRR
jgi:hypothetical protein